MQLKPINSDVEILSCGISPNLENVSRINEAVVTLVSTGFCNEAILNEMLDGMINVLVNPLVIVITLDNKLTEQIKEELSNPESPLQTKVAGILIVGGGVTLICRNFSKV